MKKINLFLYIVIIINILAMIILLFKQEPEMNHYELEIENLEEFTDVYGQGVAIDRYKEFIKILAEDNLPSLYVDTQGMDESKRKEYYQEKQEILKNNYSIQSYEDFNSIYNQMGIFSNPNIRLKKVKIIKNSCKMEEEYTQTAVELRYSHFKKLKLYVYVANVMTNDKPMFIIKAYN